MIDLIATFNVGGIVSTVADVRKFLSVVDSFGIEDSALVEGQLFLQQMGTPEAVPLGQAIFTLGEREPVVHTEEELLRCDGVSSEGDRCVQQIGHNGLCTYRDGS